MTMNCLRDCLLNWYYGYEWKEWATSKPSGTNLDYLAVPIPINNPIPLAGNCLLYRFGLDGSGHGIHRKMYERGYGEIPKGLQVLHLCNIAPCIQPGHLVLGSPKDNAADRKASHGQGMTWEYIGDRFDKSSTRKEIYDPIWWKDYFRKGYLNSILHEAENCTHHHYSPKTTRYDDQYCLMCLKPKSDTIYENGWGMFGNLILSERKLNRVETPRSTTYSQRLNKKRQELIMELLNKDPNYPNIIYDEEIEALDEENAVQYLSAILLKYHAY